MAIFVILHNVILSIDILLMILNNIVPDTAIGDDRVNICHIFSQFVTFAFFLRRLIILTNVFPDAAVRDEWQRRGAVHGVQDQQDVQQVRCLYKHHGQQGV